MCCVMRKPSPDCCTISAFLRERRKRINTEGTEAGAHFKAQDTERPQGRANPPVLAIARLHEVLFPSTVFLSAFLLFLIEPLFAKLILPRFGGAVALLFLPIAPRFLRSYSAGGEPASTILLLLSASIGLPFVLLSATSPLVQVWYARTSAQREPYHLFALSNLASLLALLSYPLLIEPYIAAHRQAMLWSALFAVFVLLCAAAAWFARAGALPVSRAQSRENKTAPAPTLRERLLWLGLAACSSMLLLSITNKLLEDVAPVPLLWVLPLALYLVTFALA